MEEKAEKTKKDAKEEARFVNPFNLKGKKLTIHLDRLNEALKTYNLKVDSLDDIFIDRELSNINAGDVIQIYTQKIEEGVGWDQAAENWFFKETKEMEEKFEELKGIVTSAELDRGDKILTLVTPVKGLELVKQMGKGGHISNEEEALAKMVDMQLASDRKASDEIFTMVGVTVPLDENDRIKKLPEVREKAIAHYKNQRPKSVKAFLYGKKMDLANGASVDTVFLQAILQGLFEDFAIQNLNGHNNPKFAKDYAQSKAILAIDFIKGLAMEHQKQNGEAPFLITDGVLEQAVSRMAS